ncbi:hypothetical protein EF849_22135, partial [Aeromonas jandaei]|nr:hypothetical protein [Aeromonas jandaei]
DGLSQLLFSCNVKCRRNTRHSLVECDFAGLHYLVSFKVKNTISARMRSITKKHAINRARFKFVQITLLQDKELAPKHPKMRHLGYPSKTQLIRCFLHESPKKDAI